MPKIKAFKGIHPAANLAEKLVVNLERFTLAEAKVIREENSVSFMHMLVPKLDHHFQRGSKLELAYKKINENLEIFLDQKLLVCDEKPAIYIYQVFHYGYVQTGIWTLTAIDDYINNRVKKHELTRPEREVKLIEYVEHTGIDTNPVLITYPAVSEIDEILHTTISSGPPLLEFSKEEAIYKLWKVDNEGTVNELIRHFGGLKCSYIADGHHRAAAASTYGIARRKLNLKHQGHEEYNFFASVYMSTDQVKIFEFNRLVKDLAGLPPKQFLEQLSGCFEIVKSAGNTPVKPSALHGFGMYLTGEWYQLVLKSSVKIADDPVACLDVSLLQDLVLSPILKINDPRTDQRLSFSGGLAPTEELMKQVDDGEYAVAFTLFPTTVEQLIAVADEGEVMPPKSTWFEPKFLTGLLIHKIG